MAKSSYRKDWRGEYVYDLGKLSTKIDHRNLTAESIPILIRKVEEKERKNKRDIILWLSTQQLNSGKNNIGEK